MGRRFAVLAIFAVVGLLLLYFHHQAQQKAHERGDSEFPTPVQLPYKWIGAISPPLGGEPSGITYHPQRKTLFVVGDEGNVFELRTDGKIVNEGHLAHADLEGITVDPATGFLYAVVESEEAILEIHPSSFRIGRKFPIDRNFEGRELLKKGGMGLEAITFIPDATHPEGGTFWVGNQSFDLKPGREPSVICEVYLPLRSSQAKEAKGKILRYFPMTVIDLSGMAYDARHQRLIVISDTTNLLLEIALTGEVGHRYLIPGDDQEGVALDQLGYIYIAQENGEILKLEDRRE